MFCKKCGNEIPDDSTFCMKCGTSQTADAPAAAPAKAADRTSGLILSILGALLIIGSAIGDAAGLFGWDAGATPTTSEMAMKIGSGTVVMIAGIVALVIGIKKLKNAKKQS